jgi:hypothetical protein
MSHGRFVSMIGILAVLVLAIFVSTWIHLEIRFTRPCRLFPQREWVLLQTQPDTFEARLLDRSAGNRQQIDLYRYRRGDFVQFSLNGAVAPGARVAAGGEVARLDSYVNRQTLEQLRPQLAEAEANLRAASTGEREEVIAQAQSEVAAAAAARDRIAGEHERAQALWEKGAVSDADNEDAAARFREAEAELDAAHNRLRVAEVGEKAAIVEVWQARRDRLRQMITDAEDRVGADRIHCPIDGEAVLVQGDSALLRVAALDTLYALAPVPPSRVNVLAPGYDATVRPLGAPSSGLPGRVVHIDDQASTIKGLSFYWVAVAVPNPDRLAVAGVRGTVAFRGDRVSLLGWLSDQIRHAADRSLGA